MTTLVIPGGKQIASGDTAYRDSAVTLFDALTNNPYYLADYIPGTGTPPNSRAYPCNILAAGPNAVWQGGRFYGNIQETAERTLVYNSNNDDFNSALLFPQNGVNLTIRNVTFGIEGNRNSGFIDGIRGSRAGNLVIEDITAFYARDDFIEADAGGNVTVRRMFGEDLYVWISATGAQPSKIIRAEDCLIRIGKWRELGSDYRNGPLFKTNSTSNSPQWVFSNVILATPRNWPENGYNRTRAALARMSCTNCTWLSYDGTLDTANGLRNAVLAAGWNLIEGSAAQTEWETQKAAWFDTSPPPPPPPADTLISPVTVSVNVTAASVPSAFAAGDWSIGEI